jgi:3',5'-cyclic-AMP phosphodiesterase
MRNLLVFLTVTLSAMLLFIFGIAAASYGRTPMARPDEPASKNEVKIDNFSFAPAALTVPAGTVITWVNHDDVPHNAISTDKKFASPVLDTDESFSWEFKEPGTYPYYCSIHPKMTGKVIVQ